MFAYCDNNPGNMADDDGQWAHVVIGALIGGAFELGSQLISNGGDFSSVNWEKVGVATVVGGATALCGPVAGAIVSGAGNVAMKAIDGETDIVKLGTAFAVGTGSSLIGYGAGKLAQKIGGNIAIKNLAKKSPGQIKRTITSTIEVAGRDRNAIINISWTLSRAAYEYLPTALVGKVIPRVFNSIIGGVTNYGAMSAFAS